MFFVFANCEKPPLLRERLQHGHNREQGECACARYFSGDVHAAAVELT